jgi:hypothetical protein
MPGAYTDDELETVIARLADEWFSEGFELELDSDSPGACRAISTDGRVLWFFVERVGG